VHWRALRPRITADHPLKYKDGEKKIFVPADAPIVAYVPGDKADLKPGAKVFILAAKQADGTLQGARGGSAGME
jgi:hypothetical protein